MSWTAVLLFKGSGARKTRLGNRLSPVERQALSQALFDHVSAVLFASSGLSSVALLSDIRPAGWPGDFIPDQGRGLNGELHAAAAALSTPLLVIHADLPFVSREDIDAMISQTDLGCAIAPDRHGTGTNALALRDPTGFDFAFGADSFGRHREAAGARARVVDRHGLGFDIDTVDDLDAAIGLGLRASINPL
jgi:2-phospho-L-lactate guanylyltransferase